MVDTPVSEQVHNHTSTVRVSIFAAFTVLDEVSSYRIKRNHAAGLAFPVKFSSSIDAFSLTLKYMSQDFPYCWT